MPVGSSSGSTTRRNVVSRLPPLAADASSSSVLICSTVLYDVRYATAIRYEYAKTSAQIVPYSGSHRLIDMNSRKHEKPAIVAGIASDDEPSRSIAFVPAPPRLRATA
jgi:hypothetical protein